MGTRLEQLFTLIPPAEVSTKMMEAAPTVEAIDAAVSGTRAELEPMLAGLEKSMWSGWYLGSGAARSQGNYASTGSALVPPHSDMDYLNPNFLQQMHERRLAAIKAIFAEDDPWVTIEDGGIKSYARAQKKLERSQRLGRPQLLPDLSRVRLVAPGLSALEWAFVRLKDRMPLDRIALLNYYAGDMDGGKYKTPFRGVMTMWCEQNRAQEGGLYSTEVQLVTERVRAVMDLNHPFDVRQTAQYPEDNGETKDWLHSLLLKATILDFWEKLEIECFSPSEDPENEVDEK